MDDDVLSKKGHVVFSNADDIIFWREIACLTRKELKSRFKSQKVLEDMREILGLLIFNDVIV